MKICFFKIKITMERKIFLLVCIHYLLPKKIGISRICFSLLLCSIFTIHSFAQETIKSEEVDIVKAYQPLLADAVKIQLHADPASIDTTMQPLQYDVKEHVISL